MAAALATAKGKRRTERKIVGLSTAWLRWASGGVEPEPTPRQKGERQAVLIFRALAARRL